MGEAVAAVCSGSTKRPAKKIAGNVTDERRIRRNCRRSRSNLEVFVRFISLVFS